MLLHVVRAGRVRISELASAEGLNPTMLSRVIAHLLESGLIERSSDADDRRAAWVNETPAGRRLAERMRRERTEAVNAALGLLSPSDRRRLEQAIAALEHLAERLGEVRP